MFWMFIVALWIAMLVSPIALLIAFLPSGRDCPRCGAETIPIRHRLLLPVRRFLHLRWCMSCGWDGVMRQAPWSRPTPAPETVDAAFESDDDAAWRGGKDG